MKRLSSFLVVLCIVLPLSAQQEPGFDGELRQDVPLQGWETEARDRLDLMAGISFTTLAPMPKTFHVKEAMFNAGERVVGIPYSSVQQFAGLVGKDISFYTFLSAVNNPQSNMYKVNYHKAPYDLLKAGPFYGLVCNVTVAYVLGIPLVMRAKHIRAGESVYLDDVGNDIDEAHLFDTFCYGGSGAHVILICGLGRDSGGKVREIKIFEATGPCNRFKTYSREEFQEKMIDKKDGHFYRYDHKKWGSVIGLPSYMEQKPVIEFEFNRALSPEDGERVTLPEGKPVRIGILSQGYRTINVFRDGRLYGKYPVKGRQSIQLDKLPAGFYEASLKAGNKESSPIQFQVGQKTCKAWYENGQLYIGGCCDGVYPVGAYYLEKGGKAGKYSTGLLYARICIPAGEGRWKVEPNIPEGSFKTLRVSLAGKYSSYWAEDIMF